MSHDRCIKILVVDDDHAVCSTVHMILRTHGFDVHTVECARDALTACDTSHFDIAMIDVKMPEVNGTVLLEQIRQVDPHLGVIIMTAYPDIDTAAKVIRGGANDFITKPFTENQLLEAVQRLCKKLGLIYTTEADLIRLIGERIRDLRKAKDMTLKQVSDRSGVAASQLSQLEHARTSTSIWSLAKISGALGVRLSELLKNL